MFYHIALETQVAVPERLVQGRPGYIRPWGYVFLAPVHPAMPSLTSFLLAILLNILQFALSVDARGSSKSTKRSDGHYPNPRTYREGLRCYDSPFQ